MDLPPSLRARYEIGAALGEGGFGAVFLATDRQLGRAVAIKLLHVEAAAGDTHRRFRREALGTARLSHPNIVRVFDHAVTPDGVPYIVYERVPGVDLDAWRAARGAPGVDRLRAWAVQGAGALATAHRTGLVHRDVKPANFMVREADGRLVLIDFGVAHAMHGDTFRTATGMILGTPGYMAPETFSGGPPSPASDQWAWAATLVFLAAGEPAYGSDDLREVLRVYPTWSPTNCRGLARVPAGLRAAVGRALHPDPARRFPSCGDFAAALAEPAPSHPAGDASTAVLGPGATITPGDPVPGEGLGEAGPDPRGPGVTGTPAATASRIPRARGATEAGNTRAPGASSPGVTRAAGATARVQASRAGAPDAGPSRARSASLVRRGALAAAVAAAVGFGFFRATPPETPPLPGAVRDAQAALRATARALGTALGRPREDPDPWGWCRAEPGGERSPGEPRLTAASLPSISAFFESLGTAVLAAEGTLPRLRAAAVAELTEAGTAAGAAVTLFRALDADAAPRAAEAAAATAEALDRAPGRPGGLRRFWIAHLRLVAEERSPARLAALWRRLAAQEDLPAGAMETHLTELTRRFASAPPPAATPGPPPAGLRELIHGRETGAGRRAQHTYLAAAELEVLRADDRWPEHAEARKRLDGFLGRIRTLPAGEDAGFAAAHRRLLGVAAEVAAWDPAVRDRYPKLASSGPSPPPEPASLEAAVAEAEAAWARLVAIGYPRGDYPGYWLHTDPGFLRAAHAGPRSADVGPGRAHWLRTLRSPGYRDAWLEVCRRWGRVLPALETRDDRAELLPAAYDLQVFGAAAASQELHKSFSKLKCAAGFNTHPEDSGIDEENCEAVSGQIRAVVRDVEGAIAGLVRRVRAAVPRPRPRLDALLSALRLLPYDTDCEAAISGALATLPFGDPRAEDHVFAATTQLWRDGPWLDETRSSRLRQTNHAALLARWEPELPGLLPRFGTSLAQAAARELRVIAVALARARSYRGEAVTARLGSRVRTLIEAVRAAPGRRRDRARMLSESRGPLAEIAARGAADPLAAAARAAVRGLDAARARLAGPGEPRVASGDPSR